MAVPNMIVTLVANTSKFTKGMRTASDSSKSFSKVAGKAFGAIGVAIGALGIGNLIGDLIGMGVEARKADKRLEYMAKNMTKLGDNAQVTVEHLKDFADKMQLSTGIDDEVIKGVQAMLLAFPKLAKSADKAGGMFDRVTKASFDMAAVGFGEAESNAKKLAKFLDDPIKKIDSLARLGIVFTDKEKKKAKAIEETNGKMKAADYLMGVIEKRVGGMSEATANPMDILMKRFGEIGETIATAVLPFIDDLATQIGDWLDSPGGKKAVEGFVDNFKDFGKWISSKDGKKAISDLVEVFKVMLAVTSGIVDALDLISKWLAGPDYKKLKKAGQDAWNLGNGSSSGTTSGTGPIWSQGDTGKNKMSKNKSAPAPSVVVNFNTPVDSVSAGREVARVLADYQRVRGMA